MLTSVVSTAAIKSHHAELLDTLAKRTQNLVDSLDKNESCDIPRRSLIDFLSTDLIPHIEAEEDLLYVVDHEPVRLLVQAMEDEHRLITLLIDEIAGSDDCADIAASASALVALCTVRIQQEDQILIPTLERHGVDVASLVHDRPEIAGKSQ